MQPILAIRNMSVHFGGLKALSELSFEMDAGETVGIIGPNGAGKTTLFNVTTGVFPPSKGQIILNGQDITGLKPHAIARKGVGRLFQLNVLFNQLSVLQNVLIGLHMRSSMKLGQILIHPSLIPKSELRMANEILEFAGLAHFKDRLASELPHGHQRLLGLAVTLASEPKMLLLDEPVTGMTVDEKKFMIDTVSALKSRNMTILLIEHDIKTVMNICPRIIVLNFGKKIAEGSPDEIRRNQDVIEAYLGPEAS